MTSEVYECPRCGQQFVAPVAEGDEAAPVRCPRCRRQLGRRDATYVLRSEIDDLVTRLEIERQRLEQEEATYALVDCAPELKVYARELPHVVAILRDAIRALAALARRYDRGEG